MEATSDRQGAVDGHPVCMTAFLQWTKNIDRPRLEVMCCHNMVYTGDHKCKNTNGVLPVVIHKDKPVLILPRQDCQAT